MRSLHQWVLVLTSLLVSTGYGNLVSKSKTLLISMDGFRWDYISKTENTPNFDKFIAEGAQAKKVTNAYATLSLPNHWTLVTGLYVETHGIISDYFYDPLWNETFESGAESKWFNNTEPIWIVSQRMGHQAGVYMWPGNEAVFNDVKPSRSMRYFPGLHTLNQSIDIAVDWLAKDGLDFACLYTDEPKKTGYSHGPDSVELTQRVQDIDKSIGHLMNRLKETNLSDTLNVLLTSGHGMTLMSDSRTLNLGDYVDFEEETEWASLLTVGLITPKQGKLEQVYSQLKLAETELGHMKVYKKEDMPDRYHYKSNRRITDIIVVPEVGWLLTKNATDKVEQIGNHGFDNEADDMKTTFIARGPDFKRGYSQETMNSIDIYPLICHLMELDICHESPGMLSNTKGMLINKNEGSARIEAVKDSTAAVAATAAALIVCLLITQLLL